MKYYIKDNYYFDIDLQNQLRIAGPQNHLLLGVSFPKDLPIEVEDFSIHKGQLLIHLNLPVNDLKMSLPLVTDIRTLRSYTEQINPKPSYNQLVQEDINDLIPKKITSAKTGNKKTLRFTNAYTDEYNKARKYGAEISVPIETELILEKDHVRIKGSNPMKVTIKTVSNISVENKLRKKIFKDAPPLPRDIFSPFILDLYEELKHQVEHLIRTKKTSSFEYGTIFPRDWIESADLGKDDLTQETVDYMYDQSMSFVSESGEGWHENIVGEYKVKTKDSSLHIDRKMIDIEPRYIMGLKNLSKNFLTNEANRQKMKLISHYILHNASEQETITFKKVPQKEGEYHFIGNWRDSYLAFPRQKTPLAPYDVNCVFYPVSLRVMREYSAYFELENISQLNDLIQKWDHQKDKFRLYHPYGITGYALALHGKKSIPLPISHLDESYDLLYNSPTLEDIVSFAKKIVDPDYFYTPAGPILVASDEDEFTPEHYHGKVIWPKQSAYSVAGLARQYKRAIRDNWPWPVVESLKKSILQTCEACFKGWEDLNSVPELYYYDENTGRARLYTDQESYEGQMSIIQLWSSIGARRIIKEYANLKKMV